MVSPRHKRSKRKYRTVVGHGKRVDRSVYAPWDYIYQVAKARKLSVAELLERAVALYEINNVPSMKELEQFREDLQVRIKLMEFRIGTSRPTDIDLSILDYYRDMLDECDSLISHK